MSRAGMLRPATHPEGSIMQEKRDIVVMGIGNPLLKDDRAGIEVVEQLEALGAPVTTEIQYTVGFEVMDKVMGYDKAIIVDACLLGNKPGTILKVSVEDIFSSHHLVNSHAVTLGSTLKAGYEVFPDKMPKDLMIYLIEAHEPETFSRECTPEVQEAIERVTKEIMDSFAISTS